MSNTQTTTVIRTRRAPITRDQVIEACAKHGLGRAAAAALGIGAPHLSRLRRQFGLIDADREQREERVRLALAHPVNVAAAMLGCRPQNVYRLRAKHSAEFQAAPAPEASP